MMIEFKARTRGKSYTLARKNMGCVPQQGEFVVIPGEEITRAVIMVVHDLFRGDVVVYLQ
jgi:hypothetical protein